MDPQLIATKWVPGSITTMATAVFFSGNSPDEKIFIDGRMPAWRINDRRIFQDYIDLNRRGFARSCPCWIATESIGR